MQVSAVFYLLLAIVAFLYASVGHGGASGYLALMSLFNMPPALLKPTALLLNIIISGLAFVQYYRGGHFHTRLFVPLALASVPAAFVGGLLTVSAGIYRPLLGVLLLFPVIKFMGFGSAPHRPIQPAPRAALLLCGGLIGFTSGLIGIGGGVILSPLLLLLGWAPVKTTAGISALFIWVNSLAALGGQWVQGIYFSPQMLYFVAAALPGGLLGAYVGAWQYSSGLLKKVLALVLLIASVKLIFT